MSISSNLKDFHKDDIAELLNEADSIACDSEQDFDAGTTEFEFADGSILIVGDNFSSAYGSR